MPSRDGSIQLTALPGTDANLKQALLLAAAMFPAVLILADCCLIVAAGVLAILAVGVLLTHPRVCFFTLLASCSLFYAWPVGPFRLGPADFIWALLALAIVLDYLWHGDIRIRLTRFDAPFGALILFTFASIPFALDPSFCMTPAIRILIIYATFRITFKLALEIGVERIVRFYIYLVFALSLANCWTFLTTGGQQRVLGIAWLTFETFAMTALPMAVAFLIWNRSRFERLLFALIIAVVAVAIFATQSRAPMLAVAIATPTLLLTAAWFVRGGERKRRFGLGGMLMATLPLIAAAGLGFFFADTLFKDSFGRVEEFFRSVFIRPEGTVALRVVLWTAAIKAFLANPLTGIGIGNFRIVDSAFPELRMTPVWYYISGLSTHNVVLHYLAETGVFGALSLIWLAVRGLRDSLARFRRAVGLTDLRISGALFISMFVYCLTILYMRAWTWGADGYIMAVLFGLNAAWIRQNHAKTMAGDHAAR